MFLTQRQLRVVHNHPYTGLQLELHQILVQCAYNYIRHLLNKHKVVFYIWRAVFLLFYVQSSLCLTEFTVAHTPALAPPRSFSCPRIGSCEATGRARQLLELRGTQLPRAAPLGSQTPVTKQTCGLFAIVLRQAVITNRLINDVWLCSVHMESHFA